MSENQTPEDFKEYFLTNFENLFKKIVNESINNINDVESNIYIDLQKIQSYFNDNKKLNYSKIMLKLSSNLKLMEVLTTLDKFDFEDKSLITAAKKYNDIWSIIPSLNVLKILFNIKNTEYRKKTYRTILKMFNCSNAFKEILNKSDEIFDPNMAVLNFSENYGIHDILHQVEIKTPDTFEFVMDMLTSKLLGSKTNSELNNEITNMTDEEIKNSSTNLNLLLADKVKEGNKSAEILTNMISKLTNKLGVLKNDKNNKNNGVKKIYDIAKEITDEMSLTIDRNTIDPMELWNTTTQLASQTVNSPVIEEIGDLIKDQIFKSQNNITSTKEELDAAAERVMGKLNIQP